MKKKTDLAAVKQLANAFLMMEPEETEFSPMIVKHPFTDSGIVGIRKADGSLAMGNIMENPDDLASWRSTLRTVIDGCESAMQVAYLLTKSYSLGFLKYAEPHLSRDSFAEMLAYMWVNTESPNNDPNLTKAKLLSMFKAASPAALMDKDELLQFRMLDDIVNVYRGVTSYNAGNVKALSWTLDQEKAEWFAHRYGENGTVYEAQISKAHIHALFNSRNESEVIVDPKHLTDITIVQDQDEAITITQ